jgi:hypothetical protein
MSETCAAAMYANTLAAGSCHTKVLPRSTLSWLVTLVACKVTIVGLIMTHCSVPNTWGVLQGSCDTTQAFLQLPYRLATKLTAHTLLIGVAGITASSTKARAI